MFICISYNFCNKGVSWLTSTVCSNLSLFFYFFFIPNLNLCSLCLVIFYLPSMRKFRMFKIKNVRSYPGMSKLANDTPSTYVNDGIFENRTNLIIQALFILIYFIYLK